MNGLNKWKANGVVLFNAFYAYINLHRYPKFHFLVSLRKVNRTTCSLTVQLMFVAPCWPDCDYLEFCLILVARLLLTCFWDAEKSSRLDTHKYLGPVRSRVRKTTKTEVIPPESNKKWFWWLLTFDRASWPSDSHKTIWWAHYSTLEKLLM